MRRQPPGLLTERWQERNGNPIADTRERLTKLEQATKHLRQARALRIELRDDLQALENSLSEEERYSQERAPLAATLYDLGEAVGLLVSLNSLAVRQSAAEG
jgi:hypothetical protein